MGFNRSGILTMSSKISQNNVKPILGFNEDNYFEFGARLKRQITSKNPFDTVPLFGIAINNSKSLLGNLSS